MVDTGPFYIKMVDTGPFYIIVKMVDTEIYIIVKMSGFTHESK